MKTSQILFYVVALCLNLSIHSHFKKLSKDLFVALLQLHLINFVSESVAIDLSDINR